MKNNDDLLSMQGNVYTLVDAEGYLVREDINGSRKRYPLTSEGGSGVEYTPGEGIFISDNEISVDGSFIDDKIHNYITYETSFDSSIKSVKKFIDCSDSSFPMIISFILNEIDIGI